MVTVTHGVSLCLPIWEPSFDVVSTFDRGYVLGMALGSWYRLAVLPLLSHWLAVQCALARGIWPGGFEIRCEIISPSNKNDPKNLFPTQPTYWS